MKRLHLLSLILVSSIFCQAQNTWVGNTSTWSEPSNWSLGVVPGPSSSVYIPTVTGNKVYPVLTGNVKVGFFSMHGGTGSIYIGSHELEVETLWVTYSKIYSDGGTIRTPMVRLCVGMNFYGNLTLYADNGVIGAGNSAVGFGANTFHGDLTVYTRPHVPAGLTTTDCWPCGGLMFSGTVGDTFKGDFKLIKRSMVSEGNISYIAFGVEPVNIVFEKKAAFIDSSATGFSLGFTQGGGSVTFRDSTLFSLNSSYIVLRGNIEFQKPVTFRQTGGSIEEQNWTDKSNGNAPRSTLVTFSNDVLLDKSGGTLALGSWPGNNVLNRCIIDTGGTIKPIGPGFSGGTLSLTLTTIHSPATQILAATHPTTPATGTRIILNNALVNGSLHVKADDIDLIGTTFNGRAVINKDGYAAQSNSKGGNTFNKPVELINSAGYDWTLGFNYSNVYRDSVRIAMSGTGKRQILGSPYGASFKVGKYGSLFEGPVSIETGSVDSGAIHIESNGNTEFLSSVDISNFRSGELTFFNSKFRGKDLGRTMTSTSPGVSLLLENNCLFEGPVSFKVPHFGSNYTTFMKPVVIWKTEDGNDSSIGGNTFHQRVQFKNTANDGIIKFLSGEDKLIDKIIPQ